MKEKFIRLILSFIITCLFCHYTELIQGFGKWYSQDINYRLQTDALLEGRVALNFDPTKRDFDWAWANGNQQVWGLGVPLIRLPFEALARVFGHRAFPDRLVFFFFYLISAYLLLMGGEAFLKRRFRGKAVIWLLLGSSALLILFAPAFMTLCKSRFRVYEEAVAYGYLWSVILLSILLYGLGSREKKSFYFLCIVSGLAGFIRPTIFAYALPAVLLLGVALLKDQVLRRKGIIQGGFLILLGVASLLASNYQRFGSPTEFGHRLNVSGHLTDYFVKFHPPFSKAPLTMKAKELIGALFYIYKFNGIDVLKKKIHPGQAPYTRSREFYFSTYNKEVLLAVCLSLVVFALLLAWKKVPPDLLYVFLFSLASILLLSVFYVNYTLMASRYLVDYALAIYLVILLGALGSVLAASDETNYTTRSLMVFCFSFILVVAWNSSAKLIERKEINFPVRYKELLSLLRSYEKEHREGIPIPLSYECGTNPSVYAIEGNPSGWDITNSCRVSELSSFFLTASPCYSVYLESTNPLNESQLRFIRLKANLREYDMKELKLQDPTHASLKFCKERDSGDALPKVVRVAWIPAERIGRYRTLYKLLKIDVSEG